MTNTAMVVLHSSGQQKPKTNNNNIFLQAIMSEKNDHDHAMTENIVEGVEVVKEAVKKELIVLWEHLASWQQDNHYIHSGYRAASNSFKDSIASLGYLHNETVNIWTHLLGSLAFAAGSVFLWHSLLPRYEEASTTDVKVFACFFLGAVICLGMSATFHTISNHSEAVSRFGNKLDYLGIVFLIWGSFIPAIYYGFSCDPTWINTYWTMVSSTDVIHGRTQLIKHRLPPSVQEQPS